MIKEITLCSLKTSRWTISGWGRACRIVEVFRVRHAEALVFCRYSLQEFFLHFVFDAPRVRHSPHTQAGCSCLTVTALRSSCGSGHLRGREERLADGTSGQATRVDTTEQIMAQGDTLGGNVRWRGSAARVYAIKVVAFCYGS